MAEDYGKWNKSISLVGIERFIDAMEEENSKLRQALEAIKECESKGQARRIAIQTLGYNR